MSFLIEVVPYALVVITPICRHRRGGSYFEAATEAHLISRFVSTPQHRNVAIGGFRRNSHQRRAVHARRGTC